MRYKISLLIIYAASAPFWVARAQEENQTACAVRLMTDNVCHAKPHSRLTIAVIPTQLIPPLPNGRFIFFVTNRQEILISSKYNSIQLQSGRQCLYPRNDIIDAQIAGSENKENLLAKGEIVTAFDLVVEVGMRTSESKKSTNDSLTEVLAMLKMRGLHINDQTRVKYLEPGQNYGDLPTIDRHEQFRLKRMDELAMYNETSTLIRLYDAMGRLITETFSPEGGTRAYLNMMQARLKGQKISNDWRGSGVFDYPIVTAINGEGLEFGLSTLLSRRYKSDGYTHTFDKDVPAQIENILLGFPTMKDDLKRKWQALSDNFKAIY